MFQDYCSSHGKPCIPGSLYCGEACRDEDIQSCLEFNNNYEFISNLPPTIQKEQPSNYHYDYNQFEFESDHDNNIYNETETDKDLEFELNDFATSPPMENIFDDNFDNLNYQNQLRSSSISSTNSNTMLPLLYDCDFCKLSHLPSISCKAAIKQNNLSQLLSKNINQQNTTNININNNNNTDTDKVKTFENYEFNNLDFDNSIKNNHELIKSNYRKWLVDITSA